VASAAAVGQLARAVQLAFRGLRMSGGLEVLGVAAAAGAGVRRRQIRHLIRVGGVARRAAQRRAMLPRIGHGGVCEADRAPVRIRVARGAITLRAHVRAGFADRARVVVAARAPGRERRMVDLHREPGERAMAGVALLRRRDVIARPADRVHTVVTARAAMRRNGGVIEARRRPGVGRMAAVAGARGRHVRGGFAPGSRAVVAAGARSPHLGVIHAADGQPGERRMAARAGVARRDVSARLADAARLTVAAEAVRARDGAVIEWPRRREPACGRGPASRACDAAACTHHAAARSHGCSRSPSRSRSRSRSGTGRSPRRCARALPTADAVLVAS